MKKINLLASIVLLILVSSCGNKSKDVQNEETKKPTDKKQALNPNKIVNGRPILIIAVREQNLDQVSKLISMGADINLHDVLKKSALYYAVELKNIGLIEFLLGKGANPNETFDGKSLFYGYLSNVLIDIDTLESSGKSLVLVEVRKMHQIFTKYNYTLEEDKDIEQIKASIEALEDNQEIINILKFNTFAFTEKVKNALDSDSVTDLKDLPTNSLDFLGKNKMGLNPFAYSLQFKKLEIANYLLDRKIGINVRDYLGRSPLMIACSNNRPINIIEKLISAGADFWAKDKHGRSVEFYATKSENPEILKKITEIKKNILPLNDTSIIELKEILKTGSNSDLLVFFNKHRTIFFNDLNFDLSSYLINQNLIGRWNLENLLDLGLDIFNIDFPTQLVVSGNGNQLSNLEKYKINFGVNSQGVPLIYNAIKYRAELPLVHTIFKNYPKLDYRDSDGNNLWVIALKTDRLDLLEFIFSNKTYL